MADQGEFAETDGCATELECLAIENRALRRELDRMRAAHEALRGSTLIWIRMYERHLERANRALAAGLTGGEPGDDSGRSDWGEQMSGEGWALLSA